MPSYFLGKPVITIKEREVVNGRGLSFEFRNDEFKLENINYDYVFLKLVEVPIDEEITVTENGVEIPRAETLEELSNQRKWYIDRELKAKGYIAIGKFWGNNAVVIVSYKGIGSIVSAEDINELKTGEMCSSDFRLSGNLTVNNQIKVGDISLNSNTKGILLDKNFDLINKPILALQNDSTYTILSPNSIELATNPIGSVDKDFIWIGKDELGSYIESAFEEPFYLWLSSYNNIFSISQNKFEFKLNGQSVLDINSNGLDLKNKKIFNLEDPVNPNDAVNKKYVDNLINGLSWQRPVKQIITTYLPNNPSIGDRYLINIPNSPNINKIAEWNGSQWVYYTPSANWAVIASDEDRAYTYNSELSDPFKWVLLSNNITLPEGTANQVLRHNGTTWVATSDLVIKENGYIGIGDGNPQGRFTIFENNTLGLLGVWGTHSDIWFDGGNDKVFIFRNINDQNGRTAFSNYHTGEVLSILNNGKVGIGNNNPSEKLEVNGNIKFNNSLICGNGIIKYDSDNKWKYSNDGVNFYEIGQGTGIGIEQGTSLPTPNATYRGKLFYLLGGSNESDKLYCCMKDETGNYSWILVAVG